MNTTIKLLRYATSVLRKVSGSKSYNLVAANEAKLYTSKTMPTNNTESLRVLTVLSAEVLSYDPVALKLTIFTLRIP